MPSSQRPESTKRRRIPRRIVPPWPCAQPLPVFPMGSYIRTYVVEGLQYELYMHVGDDTIGYQLVTFDGTVLTDELLPTEPNDVEAAMLIRQLRDEL